MSAQQIDFIGLTQPSRFPPNLLPDYCTETCETDKLCIPCQKPDISQILSVSINISLSSTKVICTPCGKKLVIEAVKHLKIMYIAAEPCETVHTAHFCLPLCMFILLKDPHREVTDICTVVEYVSIKQLDCRCVAVSALILACAILKPCCPSDPCEPCCDNHEHHHCPDLHTTCGTPPYKTELCTVCHSEKKYSPSYTCGTEY